MANYVVIGGERFDYVKNPHDGCESTCALSGWCDWENTPCSVFNSTNLRGGDYIFVKHEKKGKKV